MTPRLNWAGPSPEDHNPPSSSEIKDSAPTGNETPTHSRVGWGCFLAMLGGCVALMVCPDEDGSRCLSEVMARDAARERVEALENRADSAIGAERTLVLAELIAAREREAAADRDYRACIE